MRFALASVMLLFIWAKPAAADLYRWLDPETGSVKFSSYPPPWYGDEAKQRRAPKVEHIPAGQEKPARAAEAGGAPPAARAEGGGTQEALEARRRGLLQALSALPSREEFNRGGAAMKQRLEAYQALVAELDRVDPNGAAARRAEVQSLIEKLAKGQAR